MMYFFNSKPQIKKILCNEILDSRGNPTVSTTVVLESGDFGMASVPSGASVGKFEAVEKRDGDTSRFFGRGCLFAKAAVENDISSLLLGKSALDQQAIDLSMITLDCTKNKSNLGANAILSVSEAVAKAAAAYLGIPLYRYLGGFLPKKLPVPMLNIINGGAHADNGIDIQEFMIIPKGFPEFSLALRASAEVYAVLKRSLKAKKLSSAVGDEGGFAPDVTSEQALELITDAIAEAGYKPGEEIFLGLDVASSEWYDSAGGEYVLPKSKKRYTKSALSTYLFNLCQKYPISSIEDGMAEEDYEGWRILMKTFESEKINLVGDDLFVTNKERIKMGISQKIGNTVLLKPNQIGTLTEVKEASAAAAKAGYKTVISHRSGDTADTAIADIGVAIEAGFIKSGAPCRAERVEKYNRLLEIEREMTENIPSGI